ncbi:ribonuclease J [Pseudoxanthobacter soli DSM 19599]|uniref:Ribonuclease J n=1 Tax=Pseudoxanthobacter soli DSM 19599 TaxID=1123029 RepID=A0A1M7ZMS9_9HYPH|nr:ribonuclease J [Pseudoxanthobacter soli]SHO66181.1 ribonuclease J [Pseudoxanthobacter soli DSM 19599]
MKTEKASELVFLALGGVGEIGMNMALYGFGPARRRRWLMVDCGVGFGGQAEPGVDLVMADPAFIEAERENLLGIVLTHAHEDHYGGLVDLWPRLGVPVYATAFSAAMLEAKLDGEPGAPDIEIIEVDQGARFEIGPFDIEFVSMSHSIPEPNALVIRTPVGTVVHTGDWKIDLNPGLGLPIDLARLAEIGKEGVRALVCDSTNATRAGRSPSERDVAASLAEIIAKAPARVAVTTFASNAARLRAVIAAAQEADREVVVLGRAMKRVLDIAGELGYLDGLRPVLDEEAYGYLPRDKVVALLTGSQGERRAALARIAGDDHRLVALSPGDLVIFSSRTIPGNEKAVAEIANALAERGIDILTDRDGLVHVSGHPRRDELAELYGLLKPQMALPVHGEALHLAEHAKLARSLGVKEVVIPRNGLMVRLAPGPGEVVDEVHAGVLYKDGRLLVEPEQSGMEDRRRMSFAGVVVVSLALDAKGETVAAPTTTLIGLPTATAEGVLFSAIVQKAVVGAIESIPRPRRKDHALVAEAVRRSARSAVAERWGKKPICRVVVADV